MFVIIDTPSSDNNKKEIYKDNNSIIMIPSNEIDADIKDLKDKENAKTGVYDGGT